MGPGQAVPGGSRASFGMRLLAVLVDSIVLAVAGAVVRAVFGLALGTLVSIVLGLAYFAYLEGSPSGQTVGKHVVGIRVVDASTAGPIDRGRALVRYLGRILSSIPCGLGYFWMLWDPQKQTWHDKIAGTVVVPAADFPVAAWPG